MVVYLLFYAGSLLIDKLIRVVSKFLFVDSSELMGGNLNSD